VRVYQFSDQPRTAELVHFESVGPASANASTRVSEPPGFQLRLRILVHSADITATAYSPGFKHVVAADASGAVSLLDLAAPALLWLQVRWACFTCTRLHPAFASPGHPAPWVGFFLGVKLPRRSQETLPATSYACMLTFPLACLPCPLTAQKQSPKPTTTPAHPPPPARQAPLRVPITSLALARCPLPPPRDRNQLLGSFSRTPGGTAIPCVVALGADSSITVLDAGMGFPLAKESKIKPRHPTSALAIEMLDASGTPLWMARDVRRLVQLSRWAEVRAPRCPAFQSCFPQSP
jgi:hypothetical protein